VLSISGWLEKALPWLIIASRYDWLFKASCLLFMRAEVTISKSVGKVVYSGYQIAINLKSHRDFQQRINGSGVKGLMKKLYGRFDPVRIERRPIA